MGHRNAMPRPTRGFTLIELMIVVAVLAILVSLAVPAYQDSVRKARRGQAKADLVELAQVLERHYTVHGSYATFVGGGAYGLPFAQSPKTGTPHYVLQANPARTATTFTLEAVPQGAQTADTRCGTLSITHAGAKFETGTGSSEDCW